MDWKKEILSEPIAPAVLSSALQDLGISQMEMARLLSVNDRTVRRWMSGETVLDKSSAAHVRLFLSAMCCEQCRQTIFKKANKTI